MKIKEFIALVRNELNSITLDDRISNRFIFNKAIVYTEIIIKRESDSRRLFNSTNIFYKEESFKLKEYDSKQYGIKLPCRFVMKSVSELPSFYSSIYGNLLNISDAYDTNRFEQTTPENYKNILNREFKSKTNYYWIDNGHLIVPDSMVSSVTLRYIPKITISGCKSLDQEMGIPGWLLSDVIKYTVADIRNTKGIVKDQSPDLNTNSK